MASFQTAPVKEGDVTAIINTNQGTIKVKLFVEQAPKTCENFITHAKNGYYNGLKFHRVIKDFMIQGGDPIGNGTGGQSIWGHAFEDEFSVDLHNLRGALSMANSGPNTNGSQFFIVQASTCPEQMLEQMESLVDRGFPRDIIEDYKALGGTPWLDFRHTVFGQVYDGMDIVDNIANVKTGANDMPVDDVLIEGIEIEEN